MRLQRLNPGLIVLPATVSLSKALHDGKTLILNQLAGHTVTLPAALGTQCKLKFVTTVAPTSNSNVIKAQNTTDVFVGSAAVSGTTTASFPTTATSDTITANRGTTGGATAGDVVYFEDVAPGIWCVEGSLNGSGAVATPFSASV